MGSIIVQDQNTGGISLPMFIIWLVIQLGVTYDSKLRRNQFLMWSSLACALLNIVIMGRIVYLRSLT